MSCRADLRQVGAGERRLPLRRAVPGFLTAAAAGADRRGCPPSMSLLCPGRFSFQRRGEDAESESTGCVLGRAAGPGTSRQSDDVPATAHLRTSRTGRLFCLGLSGSLTLWRDGSAPKLDAGNVAPDSSVSLSCSPVEAGGVAPPAGTPRTSSRLFTPLCEPGHGACRAQAAMPAAL